MSRKSRLDFSPPSATMTFSPARRMSHTRNPSREISNDSFHKKGKHRLSTNTTQQSKNPVSGSAIEDGSTTSEDGNGDEADSSADPDDEDDEEAERVDPSGSSVNHKGRQSATKTNRASGRSTPQKKDRRTETRGGALSATTPPASMKKRTFSTISSTSILFESTDHCDQGQSLGAYPRKKINRRLSNNVQGLLKYDDAPPKKPSNDRPEDAIEESDDDVYNDVDAISESAQGESDVEMADEKLIIDSEDENHPGHRPSVNSGMNGFMAYDEAELLLGNIGFFDEQLDYASSSMLAGIFESATPGKKVRFEDVEASDRTSTSSSDSDSDPFPDLFLEQDRLDPGFRTMIEDAADADEGNSIASESESSFWDFRAEEADGAVCKSQGRGPMINGSHESDGGSSGYDSMISQHSYLWNVTDNVT